MKRILLVLAVLLLATTSSFAQKISIINGTWERAKPKSVKLYEIAENSTPKEIASSNIEDDNKFFFAFAPKKEAYYIVGVSTNLMHQFYFYFKPGDQLNFKVTPTSYVLEGENTPENIEMTKWHDFIQPIEDKSAYFMDKNSTYVDFFPLFEEKLDELSAYPKSNTPNKLFNTRFEDFKKYNMLSNAIMFIYSPRTAHPQGEDFPDYYREIDIPALTKTTALLDYPAGLDIISKAIFTKIRIDEESNPEAEKTVLRNPIDLLKKTNRIEDFTNDTIKGELVLDIAKYNTTYDGLIDFKQKYGKYLITEGQKIRFKKYETELFNKSETEVPAIDFKFPDKDGKEIALSDFKGKVVYIDVWATWCGPCKKEIPFLKSLEKEYHNNKNLVFLSVSIDASKDRQKWRDFLKKEQLSGVQLFAGDAAKKNLMDIYQIKGIPRFILVGKDGKIISGDAPRPSSAEIKAALDGALKK